MYTAIVARCVMCVTTVVAKMVYCTQVWSLTPPVRFLFLLHEPVVSSVVHTRAYVNVHFCVNSIVWKIRDLNSYTTPRIRLGRWTHTTVKLRPHYKTSYIIHVYRVCEKQVVSVHEDALKRYPTIKKKKLNSTLFLFLRTKPRHRSADIKYSIDNFLTLFICFPVFKSLFTNCVVRFCKCLKLQFKIILNHVENSTLLSVQSNLFGHSAVGWITDLSIYIAR